MQHLIFRNLQNQNCKKVICDNVETVGCRTNQTVQILSPLILQALHCQHGKSVPGVASICLDHARHLRGMEPIRCWIVCLGMVSQSSCSTARTSCGQPTSGLHFQFEFHITVLRYMGRVSVKQFVTNCNIKNMRFFLCTVYVSNCIVWETA